MVYLHFTDNRNQTSGLWSCIIRLDPVPHTLHTTQGVNPEHALHAMPMPDQLPGLALEPVWIRLYGSRSDRALHAAHTVSWSTVLPAAPGPAHVPQAVNTLCLPHGQCILHAAQGLDLVLQALYRRSAPIQPADWPRNLNPTPWGR